ncbi:MAG: sigma-70 family RNA polymerase sigma factor [Bacteroidales bacterium]|nr:sigma-70 family RNA polymerase sigma factor [Bacteroidales bacterium]
MPTTNARYDDFDRLVHRHGSYIRRLCWWQSSGRSEDCADLIQDCLLDLWHHRHTLRPDASEAQERLWVKFRCRSVFSHRKETWPYELATLDEARTVADESEDKRRLLEDMACGLNEREHQVLTLILDGYSRQEIAELLDLTPKHVSQIRFRIVEKMKKEI